MKDKAEAYKAAFSPLRIMPGTVFADTDVTQRHKATIIISKGLNPTRNKLFQSLRRTPHWREKNV